MFSPIGGGCGPIRRRHPFQNRFGPNMNNLWNVHDYDDIEDETEEEDDEDEFEISEEEDSDDDDDESDESQENQETDEDGMKGFTGNNYLDAKEPVPSTSSNSRRQDGLGRISHTFR